MSFSSSNPEICVGLRGNVDGDPQDEVDVSDLIYMLDYAFSNGPEPPCMEEADVNASGGIDISDVIYLVEYMFFDGPEPLPCY